MLFSIFIIFILYYIFNKRKFLKEYIRNTYYLLKVPGPPMLPIIGWTFKIAFLKPEDVFYFLEGLISSNKCVAKGWLAGLPCVILMELEDLEALLGSIHYITKGVQYDTLRSWLNDGLLTSSGEKWHQRRKNLTPAFHFKILEDSLPMMNKNAKTFVGKLLAQSGKSIVVKDFINLCTLDIICETAMGIKLDAQNNKSSQYVSDITEICEIIMKRNMYFWLNRDFTFYLTPTGFEFKKVLKRLHTFTQKVIYDRKELYKKGATVDMDGSRKKKKAFLDCLIEMELSNPGCFTEEDMREEVDTFLFEGYDTTSAAILHTMMFIGSHLDVEEKLVLEMEEIFEDSDRDVTFKDLQEMRYLDQVIKESLRMLPSVPIFARVLKEDFKTCSGYLIPRLTNILVFPAYHHYSEEIFPDAKKFDPERFSEDKIRERHPYNFIPFSAGPRNCIGQKFAMMEMKVVLSTAIRHLRFNSHTRYEDVKFCPLVITRANKPIFMEFTQRNLIKL